jgi:hypothetical protein
MTVPVFTKFTKKQAEKNARALAKKLGRGWAWEVTQGTIRWDKVSAWYPAARNGNIVVTMSAYRKNAYHAELLNYRSWPSSSPRAAVKHLLEKIVETHKETKKRELRLRRIVNEAEPVVRALYKRTR